uniref:Reverse transcriptase domain-containing protein n=1 Tax=Tanacetum cinerariifolium TaxID=118510 RepID=A0A6L2N7X2_TANCI|nr:reverse transcriptase domain-containing protein [Tanacetum cinerariifolium]
MSVDEAIERLKTFEERLKSKKEIPVDGQESLMFTQHEGQGKPFRERCQGKFNQSRGREQDKNNYQSKREERASVEIAESAETAGSAEIAESAETAGSAETTGSVETTVSECRRQHGVQEMPKFDQCYMDVLHNDEELQLNLDFLEELRECAAIREAKAKLKMTKYYNARVRGVTFRPGDFVCRSNDASHAVDGEKLGPKWEGPYEVTEALGDGAYKLRSMDETVLPRTWNNANLKRCYL